MTGAEFYAYILRKYKRTDKETECYEAITDVIEDIKYRLHIDNVKEEAYVTAGISAVGDYRIALPSDFDEILGGITLIDADSDDEIWVIDQISKREYDKLYPDRLLSTAGNIHTAYPKHFCIYGGQIYLGPVPDKTTYKYQINYTTKATSEVSSATDPVQFTSSYKERDVLRCGVLAQLHDGEENYEESNYWRALYELGVTQIDKKNTDKTQSIIGVAYHGI